MKPHDEPGARFLGIDIGSETLKVVELIGCPPTLRIGRRTYIEHAKDPCPVLLELLQDWDWENISGAAVCGRLSRQVDLPHIPAKQALARGYRFFYPDRPGTVVSLGSHGFSVLELRSSGLEVLRENNRCAQGTGNFLRQLVERFSLGIEEASELCVEVEDPAPLSGRCPVILKTDMTHLANKGEERARILAGLFDAVCQNVFVSIKPGITPPDLVLTGGVSRSRRVRRTFGEFCERNGFRLGPEQDAETMFLEAVGSAVLASEVQGRRVPPPARLFSAPVDAKLDTISGLATHLHRVRRMNSPAQTKASEHPQNLILGFDIGSTGSKLVALDASSTATFWEGYQRTSGDPVGAAQSLLRRYLEETGHPHGIIGLGVTGSGREIVGSLLVPCYGREFVFVLNEIAAHAEGALFYDPRVDTIFEIGGQDAKYIRLDGGRIIDCAMNEACSAGTGSFIEEQGQKFPGIETVEQLGQAAIEAQFGVSLGQHCSVFMAEVIGEAVAAGVDRKCIIAGLYDSIIQNYLHRVKGNRSIGKVIFCQGMPFSADALAAAVARRTGSEVVIPPNPGTVGALGIALLAQRALRWEDHAPVDPGRFLGARIEERTTFSCKSDQGCGGTGNLCRIDSIRTVVADKRQRFHWGGACSLYDKGGAKKKLPDRAPDPFREREDLVRAAIAPYTERRGFKTVTLTGEFILRGMLPFYAAFLHELGFDPLVSAGGDQAALKRGIHEANIPFCAPMQLYHGMAGKMADENPDYLLLPMLRGISRHNGERDANTCPIVQGSADILKLNLRRRYAGKILSPVIDIGHGNLQSTAFVESCERLARELGVDGGSWRSAMEAAAALQLGFEEGCAGIGARALRFCADRALAATIVLGRPYTIHNRVLNSNVPAILREQGVLAVPLDCYPVGEDVPTFDGVYWGYGQRILRAAHQIRRTAGVYAVYCSNYSCGPDSFLLHFFSFIMQGKPFAVIETDGHSGDAGTKTRIEAFLYCVTGDLKSQDSAHSATDFSRLQIQPLGLVDVRADECILVSSLGPGSDVVAAAMNGLGYKAEVLGAPDARAIELGRRHTSGKECAPMCMTVGSLLGRLEAERSTQNRFVFLMPGSRGPCRFGVYSLLSRLILEGLDLKDRIRMYSPQDSDYFQNSPPGFPALVFSGLVATDLLLAGLLDARPRETNPGSANEIYRRHSGRLVALIERESGNRPSLPNVLWQVSSGRLFGIASLLREAAREFAGISGNANPPTVALVGEIYVRLNPFANDFIIERLEKHGIRVRLAPLSEWMEYADWLGRLYGPHGLRSRLRSGMQQHIMDLCFGIFAREMGRHFHNPVPDSVAAAREYLRTDLWGEAVLTLGYSVSEWRARRVDGIVNLGPLECMPTKIAEAQFFHFAEEHKAPVITLPLDGQPLPAHSLDNFIFEIRSRGRTDVSPMT